VLSNLAAVESAQFNRDEKCRAFFALMKVTPIMDLALSSSLQFQPYERRALDVDRIVSAKTTQQRLGVEKSEIALEKSRQRWFPKLSLYLGYRDEENGEDGSDTQGEYYGAILEVPFPSQGVSDAMEAAKLEKVGAVKALSQAEESFRRQITSLEHQIEQMEKSIRLNDQLLLAKKQEIALQRASFELGKISSIELNFVEATVVNAEQRYFKNVYKHMTVVAELESLIAQDEKPSITLRHGGGMHDPSPVEQPVATITPSAVAGRPLVPDGTAVSAAPLVLGLVAGREGVIHNPAQAEQLAAQLGKWLDVPVRARLFDNEQVLADWFCRFRMIDLAVINEPSRRDPLVGDYRPLQRLTAVGGAKGLLVARQDLPETRLRSAVQALPNLGEILASPVAEPPTVAATPALIMPDLPQPPARPKVSVVAPVPGNLVTVPPMPEFRASR
jgi:hypothetical protein